MLCKWELLEILVDAEYISPIFAIQDLPTAADDAIHICRQGHLLTLSSSTRTLGLAQKKRIHGLPVIQSALDQPSGLVKRKQQSH